MKTILTCGHSARDFKAFTDLLTANDVTLLVDVRSKPFSRYCPWFNRSFLSENLPMQYLWVPVLGGLDKNIPFDDFEEGIETLIRYAKRNMVCIMCAEKAPAKCHRATKIAPALEARGINVLHIGT